MEIVLKELLKDIEFLNVDEQAKINLEQNTVIFGSNGIGKTTIYHELKKKYNEFEYLDYDETKDAFIKNKNKIELFLGIKKLEELSNRIAQINEVLSTRVKLKQKKITSKTSAKSISNKLAEKYTADELQKIEITQVEYDAINELDDCIEFIIHNYNSLREIGDISEELKLVDQNYLKKALNLLEPQINNQTEKCPVCNSPVYDLKSIIHTKIELLSNIKNECLSRFIKEFEHKYSDMVIKERFTKIIDSMKMINEDNIIDYYIMDGNFEMISKVNEAVESKAECIKEYEECLIKQEELFESLISQKDIYTDYLQNYFRANVEFDHSSKKITITFDRKVDTFSTGETNLILFITKLFSFLGSEKQYLIIDDPISSYDLVNQYHIAFHLCKIITDEKKKVMVLTHNPDVINIINTQDSSAYQYYFFDKINGLLIMNALPNDMKSRSNVLFIDNLIKEQTLTNKYLSLMLVRNDDDSRDKLSAILHYDDSIVSLGEDCGEYCGCTNQFFISYIEDSKYLEGLKSSDFKDLCRAKIISLISIRVWIEYKMQEISSVKLHGLLSNKITMFFKKNANIRDRYPHLTKVKLMNKKVMLNQNCHKQSQVQPFYYALSVKTDDILREIEEIKEAFNSIH